MDREFGRRRRIDLPASPQLERKRAMFNLIALISLLGCLAPLLRVNPTIALHGLIHRSPVGDAVVTEVKQSRVVRGISWNTARIGQRTVDFICPDSVGLEVGQVVPFAMSASGGSASAIRCDVELMKSNEFGSMMVALGLSLMFGSICLWSGFKLIVGTS